MRRTLLTAVALLVLPLSAQAAVDNPFADAAARAATEIFIDVEPVEPLECNQWYTVNSYCKKLVADCDTATAADYDAVTQCALVKTNQFGTQVCSDLGCVHTLSGTNPDVDCSCERRILLCSVNMRVYCSSP